MRTVSQNQNNTPWGPALGSGPETYKRDVIRGGKGDESTKAPVRIEVHIISIHMRIM
jgi:hypothetical protein